MNIRSPDLCESYENTEYDYYHNVRKYRNKYFVEKHPVLSGVPFYTTFKLCLKNVPNWNINCSTIFFFTLPSKFLTIGKLNTRRQLIICKLHLSLSIQNHGTLWCEIDRIKNINTYIIKKQKN